MDKLTKNPGQKTSIDSRRSFNAGEIKLRDDINNKSDEDSVNTSNPSEHSTTKHQKSKNIDKQISDLELLIKRLQDEIVEMGNKTDERSKDNFSIEIKDAKPDEKYDDPDTANTNDHTYPVFLREVAMTPSDDSKKLDDSVSNLVNYVGPVDVQIESFTEIRRNFDVLWGDDNDKPHVNKTDMFREDNDLDTLISEVKTEISEKLESLKDEDDGVPPTNSDEENM